jgi:NADPH2:quinone reductase
MADTMRAIRLAGPGGPETLTVTEMPTPQVKPGWVRIRVKAFGVNESEVTSRKGEASADFSYPRILGIEAAGVIDATPSESGLRVGQSVVTMMGGMGRSFDGSYAEYVLVPEGQVIPFTSDLPWDTIGALPEMFQTAYGSLTTGLALQPRQTVLIRGGTSTVGLSAIALAHDLGATAIATTRSADREALLREHGADQVVIDTGHLADKIRDLHPAGVDAALELVGLDVLPDTLRAVRQGGTGCFTGAVGGVWTLDEFSPMEMIPTGVRLTTYAGEAIDLPATVFAHQLDAISQRRIRPAIAHVYRGLEQVASAQTDLETGHTPGKHVVVLD